MGKHDVNRAAPGHVIPSDVTEQDVGDEALAGRACVGRGRRRTGVVPGPLSTKVP